MADKHFYVRAMAPEGHELATGIQITIPDGMPFITAHRLVVGRVTEELVRYFASECLTHIGVQK